LKNSWNTAKVGIKHQSIIDLPGGIRDLSSQLLSISEETPLSDGLGGRDATDKKNETKIKFESIYLVQGVSLYVCIIQ
jgi:hypothetical protein